MRRFETQIILVSEQIVPNVTPVLDEKLRPGNVILCATDTMMSQAQYLADFFDGKGIISKIVPLGDPYDFPSIKQCFMDLAASLGACATGVGVNLTGGTKMISIAAQMVFAAPDMNDYACFYVIPETDQIIQVNPVYTYRHELQNYIRLEDYFAIHGFSVVSLKRNLPCSEQSRRFFFELASNHEHFDKNLGRLNFLATKADDSFSLQVKNTIPEDSWDLLELFRRQGSIAYYDDNRVEFRDSEGRDFCKGQWLEYYTHQVLQDIAVEAELQDFATSVEIRSSLGNKNEIDAVILHENDLYIIECKTSKVSDKGAEILYKLDTIRSYAGLFTKPALISCRRLVDYDLLRAKDLNITLIQGSDLENLGIYLRKFLNL